MGIKVNVTEACKKGNLTVEQIMIKFNAGKTQGCDILKSKSEIKKTVAVTSRNGSIKQKLRKTGNEDINETGWDWFVNARARNLRISGSKESG
jgi:galactitol-specific phosphotransferase system IIB component